MKKIKDKEKMIKIGAVIGTVGVTMRGFVMRMTILASSVNCK